MFGEGLPRTQSDYDFRGASAAGRQKFRRLGRSGPALLKRSPIPPPLSTILPPPSCAMIGEGLLVPQEPA
jgi:hypothetical protein